MIRLDSHFPTRLVMPDFLAHPLGVAPVMVMLLLSVRFRGVQRARKCPECGAALQEGARFCEECGAPVDEARPCRPPTRGGVTARPGDESSRRGSRLVAGLVLAVVVLLVATGALAWYAFATRDRPRVLFSGGPFLLKAQAAAPHGKGDGGAELCKLVTDARRSLARQDAAIGAEQNPIRQSRLRQDRKAAYEESLATLKRHLESHDRQVRGVVGTVTSMDYSQSTQGPYFSLSVELPCSIQMDFSFLDPGGPFREQFKSDPAWAPLSPWLSKLETLVQGDRVRLSGKLSFEFPYKYPLGHSIASDFEHRLVWHIIPSTLEKL